MNEILIAILIVLSTSIGQILLKKGSIYRNDRNKSLLFIVFGYFIFILTIGLSYLLMQLIPMKYFTIIMSLNYITVMFGTKIFLNEKLERKKIIGTILVAIGIFIFMLEPGLDTI